MPFLTQGKTNWNFILVVVVFSIIVGGAILFLSAQILKDPLITEKPMIFKEDTIGKIEISEKIIIALKDFDSTEDVILHYLNQYPGEIDILENLTVEIPEEYGGGQEKIIKWTEKADLINHGNQNLIIGLVDPFTVKGRPTVWGFPYSFCILSQKEQFYEISLCFKADFYIDSPVHFIRDINNDGNLEVVVVSGWCGAHTCGKKITVIQWDSKNWHNLTLDLSMASADVRFTDYNNNGQEEIILSGGGIGSAGAGMQRDRTEIYGYSREENKYKLIEKIMDRQENIYYLMIDADHALRQERLDDALELALYAFNNPHLGGSIIEEKDRARILSYTVIQAMLVYFSHVSPNIDEADKLLNEIKDKYNRPDNPYIRAAQVFKSAYLETENILTACQAMQNEITNNIDRADFLEVYGYATERLDLNKLCPLSAEIEIKIYFSNWSRYQKLQEELCPGSYCPGKMYEKYGVSDCDYFFPVIRNIPRQKTSLDFIELALKELSKGPNQDEKAQGFGEAGPFARMIEDFEVQDGVLILKFNKEEIEKWKIDTLGETYYSLSSCECMQYYGPIMRTLNEIIRIIPGVNEHEYFC